MGGDPVTGAIMLLAAILMLLTGAVLARRGRGPW
mgnify:CR=1 FL=1